MNADINIDNTISGSASARLLGLKVEYAAEVYSIQHYEIKFVSDLWQVDGFLRFFTNKTDHHDITETLVKVALIIMLAKNITLI